MQLVVFVGICNVRFVSGILRVLKFIFYGNYNMFENVMMPVLYLRGLRWLYCAVGVNNDVHIQLFSLGLSWLYCAAEATMVT